MTAQDILFYLKNYSFGPLHFFCFDYTERLEFFGVKGTQNEGDWF